MATVQKLAWAVLLEVWEGERSLDFVVAGMASDYREGSLCLGWGLGAGDSIKRCLYIMTSGVTTQPSHLLAQYSGSTQ